MSALTLVSFISLITSVAVSMTPINNVCKTWLDYAVLPINPNCWWDPDVNSNTIDMVNRNGYPLEMYSVTTEDGYILSLYRIPHNNNKTICSRRQPVYIQHGIQASSEGWVDRKNKSLAFFLVDHCYDVWLGNFRGSPHSQKHEKYSLKDPKFWNHSFHDMGMFDLPANVDLIRQKTDDDCKIIYIGHSMGTTASYVYAILRSKEAESNLAGLISLSPVAYMSNVKSPVRYLAPFWKIIIKTFGVFGIHAITIEHFRQQTIASVTCQQFYLMPACLAVTFATFGPDKKNLPAEELPIFFSYFPLTTSLKALAHYGQEVVAKGRFQFYDYENNNMAVYGTETPPEYDVTKISLPVHLLYGKTDFLANEKDVYKLYNKLQTKKSISRFDYNHIDFTNAIDVEKHLYPKLLTIMNSLSCENEYELNK